MQDIHSIIGGGVGGGGIRLYNGGDRRSSLLRPQNQNHEMKCPRCDSLNTKFCYYNNYNLSQPRHFCKSCRRYWTKGGVLRNVPVGGGFRKNKRAKVKQSPESKKERKSSSNSSSESSNLTGTTTTPVTTVTTTSTSPEADIAPDLGSVRCLNSDISPFSLPESRFFVPLQYTSSNFDQIPPELETLPEVGSFMNMITPSSSSLHDATALNYKASETMTPIPYRSNQQEQQQIQKITTFTDELRTEFFNNHQTVQFDLPVMQNRSNSGDFTTFDWQGSGNFESTETVHDVDQVIWNHNQWSDHDNSLYLP